MLFRSQRIWNKALPQVVILRISLPFSRHDEVPLSTALLVVSVHYLVVLYFECGRVSQHWPQSRALPLVGPTPYVRTVSRQSERTSTCSPCTVFESTNYFELLASHNRTPTAPSASEHTCSVRRKTPHEGSPFRPTFRRRGLRIVQPASPRYPTSLRPPTGLAGAPSIPREFPSQ